MRLASTLYKIKNFILSDSSQKDKADFYRLSPTCQIPKLSTIYEMYFGQKDDGCFVEVGAYDGEYVSNTSGLADIGWYGYFIEPVPEHFRHCETRHTKNGNTTVSQHAIGAKPAKVGINVGGALSTISDRMQNNFNSIDWAKNNFKQKEKIQVNQITLESYLIEHAIQPMFELLVIDVEGYEWEVLRNFSIRKWQPQMVIIELHDQNNDYLLIREECNNIVSYFDKNDYKVVFKDFTNTVYIPKSSYPNNSITL